MNLAYILFSHTDYLILDYQNMGATNIKSLNKLFFGIFKKDYMQTFLMLVYFGPCTNIYDRNCDLPPLMLYLMLMIMSKYQTTFILNLEERTPLILTIELDNIRVTRMVARMLKRKKCKKRNEIKKPMVFSLKKLYLQSQFLTFRLHICLSYIQNFFFQTYRNFMITKNRNSC